MSTRLCGNRIKNVDCLHSVKDVDFTMKTGRKLYIIVGFNPLSLLSQAAPLASRSAFGAYHLSAHSENKPSMSIAPQPSEAVVAR